MLDCIDGVQQALLPMVVSRDHYDPVSKVASLFASNYSLPTHSLLLTDSRPPGTLALH